MLLCMRALAPSQHCPESLRNELAAKATVRCFAGYLRGIAVSAVGGAGKLGGGGATQTSILRAEVNDLKHGLEAVEARARSELGMIKEGETFYQIVQPDKANSDQKAAK